MQIPWWAKIGAKLILSRIPFSYATWQRFGIFRHGHMDVSKYAIRVFNSHCDRAGLTGKMFGKTVLELGPGDSIASAVIAASHGARAILVDSGQFVRSDISPYLELEQALRDDGLDSPNISTCESIGQILKICDARYFSQGLRSLREIDSDSVEFIFSQAVLEHVRKRDFLNSMRECRRVLKFGGVCSHQIDLRDHLDGGHNNLRFSERIWESDFFAESGFYTNRILCSEMLELFGQIGFSCEVTDIRRWPSLPTPRNRLSRQFRYLSESELCVSGFHILLH